MDSAIKYSSELSKLWEKGNLKTKKSIQYMLFPEGILFDFKNKVYRTTRVNLIFDAIGSLSSVLELKKSGKNSEFSDFSRFVPPSRPNMNDILEDTRDLARIWDLYGYLLNASRKIDSVK